MNILPRDKQIGKMIVPADDAPLQRFMPQTVPGDARGRSRSLRVCTRCGRAAFKSLISLDNFVH
jgi:hypothetical protein